MDRLVDMKVLTKFEEQTVFGEENRYIIKLPYKLDPDLVGDNYYRNAYNRLWSLLNQFGTNKDLLVKR